MNSIHPYSDIHPPHLSSGPAQVASSGPPPISQYSYHQPHVIQPTPSAYPAPHHSYSQYPYGNGVSPTQSGTASSHGLVSQSVALPAMPASSPGLGHQPGGQSYAAHGSSTFDATGQVAPPGMKPRVTATLWEDEGSLCFQVEAKGVCVARREDNHMINGTKLLNVAGMTRGRRDGILKSEKTRHVVKIGPMHLKGVWIPFDRALDFANKEKITDSLYPLFVHDIGALLYHPTNQAQRGGAAAMAAAADRRRSTDQRYPPAGSQAPGLPHYATSVSASDHVSHPSHQIVSQHSRPSLDRAHTFPTPPTSASSLIGMGHSGNFSEWSSTGVPNMHSSQPLSIDTTLTNNTRSVPTTPATTPPANMPSMQPYQTSQSYEAPRSMYSLPPSQQQYGTQPSLMRYGQSMSASPYPKTELGQPPSRGPEGESHDSKPPTGLEHAPAGHGEDEADHEHDAEFSHPNASYSNRSSYGYSVPAAHGSMHSEHPHLSPEIQGSPSHQAGSGRGTPRNSAGHAQTWPSNYSTPQRSSGGNLYNVVSDARSSTTNGASAGEAYPPPSAMQSGYASQPYMTNGTPGSNKRSREDDDESDPYGAPINGGADVDGLKRRKTTREDSIGGPLTRAPRT